MSKEKIEVNERGRVLKINKKSNKNIKIKKHNSWYGLTKPKLFLVRINKTKYRGQWGWSLDIRVSKEKNSCKMLQNIAKKKNVLFYIFACLNAESNSLISRCKIENTKYILNISQVESLCA